MFANFHGLNVKLVSELRKLLRHTGSKYFVTRKLWLKSFGCFFFGGEMPKMEGEMAIVYASGDALSSAGVVE